MLRNLVLWLIIALILMSVFSNFNPRQPTANVPYSQFVTSIQTGEVSQVEIDNRAIKGRLSGGEEFTTYIPIQGGDPDLLNQLLSHKVEVIGRPPEQQSLLMSIFISWFPIILFIGVWIFFMRQMQGGGGGGRGAMSFGKSRARLLGDDQIKVTFADVAGVEEAKEEVHELVDFLKDPEKFQKLGGRIPKGVLLVGQPGTGKTLLAKAIAGEAKVPFFSISGSDFVEMFVGVGASRVRDMFEQAKKQAPCIIFIDEIDAVGRHRGAGLGGGHDEREQTLNQLLVEMDGFEGTEGVIVIAATNRPDVLDKALLRPGRFDRQVVVGLPDIFGREQILKVHMRKLPVAEGVDPRVIARGTPGFSGADLANLVNEAALIAARSNESIVTMDKFDKAKDRIMMGAERRSLAMSDVEKKTTAYHEAGHAIVGLSVPEHDPVYKVSIIPRSQALGVTMFLPEQDRYSVSKRRLLSQIAALYGGRVAEELIFGKDAVTTGASNDIQRATELARNMVTQWGLSEKLGAQTYAEEEGEVFLGRQMNSRKEISDATASVIDQEIRDILDSMLKRTTEILVAHEGKLHAMAEALLKFETIDALQINDIMEGRTPREPVYWEKPASTNNDENPKTAPVVKNDMTEEDRLDTKDADPTTGE